jgi:hypothetical protein
MESHQLAYILEHDRPLEKGGIRNMIAEIGAACLLMRTRLISRVITDIYDEQLRPLEISSAQFALLVAICQVQPATRADIGRHQHLDRSTLTRHFKVLLSGGWAEEIREGANGRSRPIVVDVGRYGSAAEGGACMAGGTGPGQDLA